VLLRRERRPQLGRRHVLRLGRVRHHGVGTEELVRHAVMQVVRRLVAGRAQLLRQRRLTFAPGPGGAA